MAVIDTSMEMPKDCYMCFKYGCEKRKTGIDCCDGRPTDCPLKEVKECKDCKWWKESDGTYKRGYGAESKCPINTKTVYLGEGYCYIFEPKMVEEQRRKYI